MKKLLALLLSMGLVLTACGGGQQDTGKSSGGQAADKPKELTVWLSDSETKLREAMQSSVDAFHESQNEVKVKVEYMDDEALKTKIKVAGAGGQMPDVFNYWSGEQFNSMVRAGVIADISDEILRDQAFIDHFSAGALDAGKVDGKLYSIAAGSSNVMFYYNKKIFAENDIAVPATWGELISAVGKLQDAGVTPIAVGAKDRWPLLFYFAYLSNRIGGTEPFMHAVTNEGDFTDPSFVEAGEKLRELAKAGAFGDGFLGMASAQSDAAFQTGKAAMILMGDWSIGTYADAGIDLGYFPFPAVENGKGDASLMHGGFGGIYAVSASADQDAATKFLKFIMTPEQRKNYVIAVGSPSSVKVNLEDSDINPIVADYLSNVGSIASGYFPYFDQAIDARRAEQILNAVVSIVAGAPDIAAELAKIK
ncbi:ABC transporter substrate-binding protein [Paenibacillus sp. GM2]|uniref:ABC transporter substrate-binding protein n=1 Tax=Paenibacillus sp. GM2 TaxID=1622070 RepID=UPI000838628F|nr:extracellular solute-binding protein [Paenibacillus sp. GM2]